MSRFFPDYPSALEHATARAAELDTAMGIHRVRGPLENGYTVSMIPRDPANRFGRDASAEAVNPPQRKA